VAAAEAAGGDDHGCGHQDDVFEDVLAFQGGGDVGAGEQPSGQQHDGGQDAEQRTNRYSATRSPRPLISSRPMAHSRVAINTSATRPGTSPKNRRWVVVSARFWAGLTPGKYLRTPKAKKTTPMLMRSATML